MRHSTTAFAVALAVLLLAACAKKEEAPVAEAPAAEQAAPVEAAPVEPHRLIRRRRTRICVRR